MDVCDRGPQSEVIYNKLLPYADGIDVECVQLFKDIKLKLGKAVAMRELRPGACLWSERLMRYISVYGFKFSKEEHIVLIRLMYELTTIPDLEPNLLNRFCLTLICLLKKKELISPEELTLPWRPLYDICKKVFLTPDHPKTYHFNRNVLSNLSSVIHLAKSYFPLTATVEILDDVRPKLCPFIPNLMSNSMTILEWFLPVTLAPENSEHGYKLWLEELMRLWLLYNNNGTWEKDVMWIMARLAWHNIGYIDWEPHMTMMFNRFLKAFNLPVTYKKFHDDRKDQENNLNSSAMALWIVSVLGGTSTCQQHLDKLMRLLSVYYYPTNTGPSFLELSKFLKEMSLFFVQRVNLERYKKMTWETNVKSTHRLTDDDINHFVETLKPAVLDAIYGQFNASTFEALHHLATLQPKLMVFPIIDRFNSYNNCLTEPHQMMATMNALVVIARPMLEGKLQGYPEGYLSIIPLMFNCLPALDINNLFKCLSAYDFYIIVFSMIPIVNISQEVILRNDLTEVEKEVYAATAQFEDFVVSFMDRMILILLHGPDIHHELIVRKRDNDSFHDKMFLIVMKSFLQALSPEFFQLVLRKLVHFINDNTLELNFALDLLTTLCQAFLQVKPVETLDALLPLLCSEIISRLNEPGAALEQKMDSTFLYKMNLVSKMVRTPSLLPHMPLLTSVLDHSLHLRCQKSRTLASEMLLNIMCSLSDIMPKEYPNAWSEDSDKNSVQWGHIGRVEDLQVTWYVPDDDAVAVLNTLVSKYLPAELDFLNSYIENSVEMDKEALHCSLDIIISILGCQPLLPVWEEPAIAAAETCLKEYSWRLKCRNGGRYVTLPGGENIKKTLAHVMDRLHKKLLFDGGDDTESFQSLIFILRAVTVETNNLYKHQNVMTMTSYKILKRVQKNFLLGEKKNLRPLIIQRTKEQDNLIADWTISCLTITHLMIIRNIMQLCTNRYSEIRSKAQLALFGMLMTFTDSCLLITDDITFYLQLDPEHFHEQFKGVLHTIIGFKELSSMLLLPNWKHLSKLLPAIVDSSPSEKPSVVRLIDTIARKLPTSLSTFGIKFKVPDVCIEIGKSIWSTEEMHDEKTMQTHLELGEKQEMKRNAENEAYYRKMESRLLKSLQKSELHWRNRKLGTTFLHTLVHPEIDFSEESSQYFVDCLISDTVAIRKAGIRGLIYTLKQQKPKFTKVPLDPLLSPARQVEGKTVTPGVRQDNKWLLYDIDNQPNNAEDWEKPRYVHKLNVGFYYWPREILVYGSCSDQPVCNRPTSALRDPEKPIEIFFSVSLLIEKVMFYLSLEENKGKDKFDLFRSIMFKGLCRNFGDGILIHIWPYLGRYVRSKQESHQRAATEIIAGIARGMKHWPFHKVQMTWNQLIPLIKQGLENITPETVTDWGTCIATAMEGRDPNKSYWLLEALLEEPVRDEASHISCGRLYVLQGAMGQLQWKIPELNARVLKFVKPFLDHPYQNIRMKLGSLLTTIFASDSSHVIDGAECFPKVSELVDDILPNLEILTKVPQDLEDVECKLNNSFGNLEIAAAAPGPQLTPAEDLTSTLQLLKTALQDVKCELEIAPQKSAENHGFAATPTVLTPNQERKSALQLLKTVCRWISSSVQRSPFGPSPHLFRFLPILCELEVAEVDVEVATECTAALAGLCSSRVLPHHVPMILTAVNTVACSSSWKARVACLHFIQTFVHHNIFILLKDSDWMMQINKLVLKLLCDEWSDVRIKASDTLSSLFYADLVEGKIELLDEFKLRANSGGRKPKKLRSNSRSFSLNERHSGILGLVAFINGHPYTIPEPIPELLTFLSHHTSDPAPIPDAIHKCLSEFQRSHHEMAKLESLPEEVDEILKAAVVPPSYIV